MLSFKTEISGEESLDEDIDKEAIEIYRAAEGSLHDVGAQMIRSLQSHIYHDWYEEYFPKVYIRRTDKPYYGTPLGSEKNMDVSVDGLDLEFAYNPTGEHKIIAWSNHRWGDALIMTIQNDSPWTWDPHAGQRPFWNLFVEEQEKSGIIESFIFGMRSRGYKVEAEGGEKDVTFDGNESKL